MFGANDVLRLWFLFAIALSFFGPRAAVAKEEVKVGVYVNDIHNLDLKTHSYTVDLYIWFRWKNPDIDPAATLEFINSTESWGHTKTQDSEKPIKLDNGEYYQVIRNQGRFS